MTNLALQVKNEIMKNEATSHIATRAITEVQAQLFAAKQFNRDEEKAYKSILNACKRPGFADKSIFSFPRGGEVVQGGTIRLAEAMAKYWGNIQHGTVEVERDDNSTKFKSYAWDLETNVRVEKEFTVVHKIKTRKGVKTLDDPRDIYEHVANHAARRRRNCIFELLPTDFIEDAIEACKRTMIKDSRPKEDILKSLKKAFGEFNVTEAMIKQKYNCDMLDLNNEQIQELRTIYTSLKDGQAYVRDFFSNENQVKESINVINNPEPKETEVELPFEDKPKKNAKSKKVNVKNLYSLSINKIMQCKDIKSLEETYESLKDDMIHLDDKQVKDIIKTFEIQHKQSSNQK